MKPIKDYVLIKPDTEVEKGGLVLPIKDDPVTGLVEDIGSEVKHVLVGKRYLFDRSDLKEFEDRYLLKEERIICQI